jgi:thiol:disulfide interchange protein DsbD
MTRTYGAILLLLAAAAFAQFDAPPANLVDVSGSVQQRNGDEIHGTITAKIADGWHINSAKPLEAFSIPTVLTLDPASGDLVNAEYPAHVIREFTFSAGTKLAVYEGTIQIPFTAKLKAGAKDIHALLRYQACNDKVCLPPKSAEATFSADATRQPGAAVVHQSPTFTPLSAAPKNAMPDNAISRTLAESGLPKTLLILFLGGLALNLTPCVFPMIPITMGFFGMQSDGRRSRRFALSALYVLGIVITYSTLGVVAALSGKLFGAWLQHPAVLISLALFMVILSTSMFGFWDITVPQFIANRAMGRAGLAGAMTMGLIVGIVAAPCVGPVVAALFAVVAATANVANGLALFAALGFGLGFPYLIALNALPKPGEWMEQVKKAMGFVLIAMAFYFVRPLIGDDAFRWGVAISLLIGAIFLFVKRSAGPRGGKALRLACAALLLVGGAAFAREAVVSRAHEGIAWQRYDRAAITASKQPVVIDFYADWCLPCKELDEKTFSDPAVAAELGRFTRVKANLTNDKDDAVKQLTKDYAIVGVPTLVFIDSSGHEVAGQRLTGFEPPKQFISRLQQVK